MSESRTQPPAIDEVEVSIFGPGKGESVAVHLGGGDWLIVDSCVDQQTKKVPVLEYLNGLSIDLATKVKLVVGTHAHDDHIAGLSQVLAACNAAPFVGSTALTLDEFMREMELDEEIERRIRKSIRSEYRAIFDIIETRPPGRGLKRAIEGRPLLERQASGNTPAARVIALSPSDWAVERSRDALERGLAQAGARTKLGSADPNEFAVALAVTVGDAKVLLGADLLYGPAGCGWQAVLDSFSFDPLASVFKIPHHGSPNAHHDGVWGQLVSSDAISLLAPFRSGSRPLPAPSDIERLKGLCRAVYCSASPRAPAPNRAVREASGALSTLATNVRTIGYSGQVRARRVSGSSTWSVTTFPPARQL